jgi:hypothetical protein
MSVDSYIAGPNGEMDWMVWNWDDKLKNYVFKLTEPVDAIILGRKMTNARLIRVVPSYLCHATIRTAFPIA